MLAPEELGSVSITVARTSAGPTAIHVVADRLETLHLLQTGHADLTHALDQAGVAPEGRVVSFSWGGGDGNRSAWSGQGREQGEDRGNYAAHAYNEDKPPLHLPSQNGAAVLSGSVDITA